MADLMERDVAFQVDSEWTHACISHFGAFDVKTRAGPV
jgi:hypothetical protein